MCFHLAVCYCFELCMSYIIETIKSYLVTIDEKFGGYIDEWKYDKHRKELLEEDFNKHRELTEPAKFHSQTVGSRGPVLEQDSVLHESLQQFIHEKF